MTETTQFPARPEGVQVNRARSRGWGSGWPDCQRAAQVTVTRPDGLRMPIRREIAELVAVLLAETERRGYDIDPDQTGGFVCRAIRGTSRPSNHSWGLAVDINWRANPHRDILITDMPAWLPALWWKYDFFWGGWYRHRPDPMHYEFVGTPEQAADLTSRARDDLPAAVRLVGNRTFVNEDGGDRPASTPRGFETFHTGATPGQRVLREGSAGDDVAFIQRALGFQGQQVDGLYGEQTEAAVRTFQAAHSLTVDGIVGQHTWSALMAPSPGDPADVFRSEGG